MLEPAFKTARFDVFEVEYKRDPAIGFGRRLYFAVRHDCDMPRPACFVTIFMRTQIGHYIEWIEVDSFCRRQGIATEILTAIQERIGELVMDGVSDEGIAFVKDFKDRSAFAKRAKTWATERKAAQS